MAHEIIPAYLAVKAMRDSGFKDAAHAIAELVDNSIQAGAKTIELICVDNQDDSRGTRRVRINKIGLYDNGSGMDPQTLRMSLQYGNGTHLSSESEEGIGKFGMGLPNSSLSQCRRVDVWSWQNGDCYYSYLDLDDIINGKMLEIPEPVKQNIPSDWDEYYINDSISDSGTLVVWNKLDRVRWKSSKALLLNSEFIIGRMYRYFIHQGTCKISLNSYQDSDYECMTVINDYAKPNDPLYMMEDTTLPELPSPHEHESMFEKFGDDHLDVILPGGNTHRVKLKFSIVKNTIRKSLAKIKANPGHTIQGKHASKNIGVSVVRAGRELEIETSFTVGYDPVERWWGAEISFPPALDSIFGVTNNKQAATQFKKMSLEKDAESEGLTPQEYKDMLVEDSDPRIVIYELSSKIESNLSAIRGQLSRVREGTRKKINAVDPAEEAATRATQQRQRDGFQGDSDRDEEMSTEQRETEIEQQMIDDGVDPEEAKEIAVKHVESGLKYIFQEIAYDGPSFFSSSRRGGSIIVNVNSKHPITQYLYDLLEDSDKDSLDSLLALKLILSAWARMEDETNNEAHKERLVDMRNDWGRLARDFIRAAKETQN